jgi:DNA polymerase elongation subunit (family B)
MKFYTSFKRHKGYVLLRGYEFGNRVQKKIHYEPTLYVSTTSGVKKDSGYRTLDGTPVAEYKLDNMWEGKQFLEKYSGVEGISVHGSTNYEYACINELYAGQIEYDPTLLAVVTLDIETDSSSGFPNIQTADKAVTAITLKRGNRIASIGMKDYRPHLENVEYYKCENEHALLEKFLELWDSRYFSPDILTGWNIEFFDLPYLVNRITRLFSEDQAKRLSPWKLLDTRNIEVKGREQQVFIPAGIAVLDYMRLYKKFSFSNQESYALNYIAEKDLGEKKLDYSEYGSLDELYKKNFQKFMEYNIHDVNLVARLEDKHRFIEQVMAIAYDAKVNFEDCFTTVKMWDTIIHNYLLEQKIVVPHFETSKTYFDIIGGYVKEPKPGMYDWVVSFDLTSLYPHLIMQYNISPETYHGKVPDPYEDDRASTGYLYEKYADYMRTNNVTITPNGCIYSREKQGFLPALMEKMFDDRARYKKLMLDAKKKFEETKDPEWGKKISAYHNLQLAKKIQLNSAYGALGNIYFRWFSADNAEAITTSGRLSIRWVENKMNDFLNRLLKTEGDDYVIACDTDSMYVNFDKLVRHSFGGKPEPSKANRVVEFLDTACTTRIEPYIASCYDDLAGITNAYQQKMHMKREAIADKGVWTGKKHYVMHVYNEEGVSYSTPKMKMVGIEAVRSSTPKVCRESIKKAIQILMTEGRDSLIVFIDEFEKKFRQMSFEEVAFPRGLKGLGDYRDNSAAIYKKGTPIQVRGALLYNHHVKMKSLENKYQMLGDGDKIKFCYLKKPNPIHENVISCPSELPKEFGLERYIDYDTQFEKAFLDPIKSITDVLRWDLTNSATLEDFFGGV